MVDQYKSISYYKKELKDITGKDAIHYNCNYLRIKYPSTIGMGRDLELILEAGYHTALSIISPSSLHIVIKLTGRSKYCK